MALLTITRRVAIAATAAFTPMGNSALAFEATNPQGIAPANPGGRWNFTCRQAGKTIQDLVLGTVQVTNMACRRRSDCAIPR